MNKKNHIEINQLDEKKKSSLANRLIVAAVLLCTCGPCAILGGWFMFALVFVALTIAAYEVLHATKKKYGWYVHVFTYLLVCLYAFWHIAKYNVTGALQAANNGTTWTFSLEKSCNDLYISPYTIALGFAGFAFFGIAHEDFLWNDIAYLFTMTLVIGLGFQSVLFVRYFPSAVSWGAGVDMASAGFLYWRSLIFFIYVVLTTFLNDAWAYFVGMLFGKHHVNPRVSPNKTWEGFFGGWILAGLSGIAFAIICEALGFEMLPFFKAMGGSEWWWLVVCSFAIPMIGNLGDFTMSFIKRHYEIKDYSKVLGAHGGILDRVDSLIFTCIFAAMFAVMVAGGFNLFA